MKLHETTEPPPPPSHIESLVQQGAECVRTAGPGQWIAVKGGGTKPGLSLLPKFFPASDKPARKTTPTDGLGMPGGLDPATSSTADPYGLATHSPASHDVVELRTDQWSGILEYRPEEFTITAYAGTKIVDLMTTLRQHGQYLPFDPPFQTPVDTPGMVSEHRQQRAEATTVGGTVAAGINGPGRLKHGGLRDFMLEVRYLDGEGTIRRGGRRVVKNAAGFDLPKLFVGSCGRLGVIIDVTFKVFPRPLDFLTLHIAANSLDQSVEIITILMNYPWDLDALEIQSDGSVLARLAGAPEAVTSQGQRLLGRLHKFSAQMVTGSQQSQLWSEYADRLWGQPNRTVMKVPMGPRGIFELDEAADELELDRSYGSGGNVGWLSWESSAEAALPRLKRVHRALVELQLRGQVIQGPSPYVFWGWNPTNPFWNKIKQVFDPSGRLGNF